MGRATGGTVDAHWPACDFCERPGEALHAIPSFDRPEHVALVCDEHVAKGEWDWIAAMDDGAAPELELIRPGIDKAVRVAQEVLEERESILENPTCHRCDTQFGGRELHPGANWYWCPACEEIFEAELGADTDSASSRGRGRRWPAWAIVVGVLLALLYFNGSLDKPLSSVHLNFHSCIENALGASFCGDDATRYCKNTADLRHLGGGSANDACDKLLAP